MAKREFCSAVWDNECLDPPGYSVGGLGGGVYSCERPSTSVRCAYCDEPVCANCRFEVPRDEVPNRNLFDLPVKVRLCKTHSEHELQMMGWLAIPNKPEKKLETEVL